MRNLQLRFRAAVLAPFLMVAAQLAGQTPGSVAEPFAAFHSALDTAVDSVLGTKPMPPVSALPPAAPVPGTFRSALARVQDLRPALEPVLRNEGVPLELAAVVLVESGGRPAALSPRGALGLWQLMPDTARRYGLRVMPGEDERADLTKATQAAARHLRELHEEFGDWPLAFAAYNAGAQVVYRAAERAGSRDFQRLSAWLPAETRAYVPAVLAAMPLFGPGAQIRESTVHRVQAAQILYATAKLSSNQ